MSKKCVEFKQCCNQCWHSIEKPCPQLIECIFSGPLCHENNKCKESRIKSNRTVQKLGLDETVIWVGAGTCGLGAGADKTMKAIKAYLKTNKLKARMIETGCIGLCSAEPIVDVQIENKTRVSFQNVTEGQVDALLDNVFAKTPPVESSLGQYDTEQRDPYKEVPYLKNHAFFGPQTRWVLENCGVIDPQDMFEYIAHHGYEAYSKVLRQYTQEEVCAIIKDSGLRGRGGGGFSTGLKWELAMKEPSVQKYIICNADEGDPGAFMDRAIIEGDPHRLIEGLAIGAYAIGATKAYIYIRAEYPLAIERLQIAIKQARDLGVIGYNILDSGINFDIKIKKGAGAFVCGEETALIHSIEGKRGMPRPRPPYPTQAGLFKSPTVINNVETFGNVAGIIQKGAQAFNCMGTKGSKGTKVFALSGKVQNSGLIEIQMGQTIEDVVFKIGGGVPNGKKFKAVQIGGPSGGCIPPQQIDTVIDYESLKSIGAMVGSGGLVVMDEDNCMVDVAKFFMEFIQRESCGKCIPCREGTRQMLMILQAITSKDAKGDSNALKRFKGVLNLESLAQVIKETSLCGLGQTASNPVLTTLRWFKDEYDAHIFERRCPAGACVDLVKYEIVEGKCKGCTVCAKKCPTNAIIGAPKQLHVINYEKCTTCGICQSVCKFDAVIKK